MRQRPAGVLPVARRGCDPDPETAAGGAERGGAGANAAIRRPRPHHRLRRQHAAAGLRQRDPDQPDLESRVRADAEQSGLAVATGASFFKPPKTVPTRTTLSHPAHAAIGFTHLENRLKNRDLDDRRFWKRLYYGPSPNVDKTRVFRTGRPLIKRCVHEIAAHAGYPVRRGLSIPSLTPPIPDRPPEPVACHRHRHRHCERSEAIHGAAQRKMDCFAALAMTVLFALLSRTASSSRRGASETLLLASAQRGRGERRMPNAPAASCAIVVAKRTRVTTSTPESPDVPARNGFTAYFVLSPVTGLFCHRRLRTDVLSAPGRADTTSANLTLASGRQDHTTSPYAATSLVRVPSIAHKFFNLPCDPVARKTLPRPPHPTPRS